MNMIAFLKSISTAMTSFSLCDVTTKRKMGCSSCCGKTKTTKVKPLKVRYIRKTCGYNKLYLKE